VTRKKRPYVPPRPAPTPAAGTGDPMRNAVINRAVTINLQATTGRADIRQGQRVQISSGLYEGDEGVVESMVPGVIPAAVIRTADGRSRRVRTVDVTPIGGSPVPREAGEP
jgi:hypothetical protein